MTPSLSDGVTSDDIREASDPSTPSSRLHRLIRSRHRDVRRAVARNPNASLADLDVLSRRFADDFAVNPVIDWLMLTNADWLDDLSAVSRHRVLASTASIGLLWWAVNSGDDEDRTAAAANRACSAEILRAIAALGDDGADAAEWHISFEPSRPINEDLLREAMMAIATENELADLLASDLLPRWLVEALPVPSDSDARRELARHRWAGAQTLRELLGDDEPQTRHLATANPNVRQCDVELWNRMGADDPDLEAGDLAVLAATTFGRERCAHHPGLSDETRHQCVTDSSWRIREAVARNPGLTVDEAAGLAVDADRDVRAAVVSNGALPLSAALGLALDTDLRVRVAVHERLVASGAPAESEEQVLPVDAEGGLLERPTSSTPLQLLQRRGAARSGSLAGVSMSEVDVLTAEEDVLFRSALACNPTAPMRLLHRLAADQDPLVRRQVAAHVSDYDLLTRLCGDPHADVQAAAASNPHLPSWLAQRLASGAADDVRVALATRADVTRELLGLLLGRTVHDPVGRAICRLLGHHQDDAFRDGVPDVFGDPGAMEAARLTFEHHAWAALVALRSPLFPTELLSMLRNSPNWRIRQSVAQHPNTSDADLRALALDPDNDVRAAVAANRVVDPDSYPSFTTETDEKVRRALVGRDDISVRLLCLHLLGDDGIRSEALTHPNLPNAIRSELDALRSGGPIDEFVLRRFIHTSARRLVVAHPATPADLLHEAAADPSWNIREAVARHMNCCLEDLQMLSADQDRDVRAAVGGNPAAPVDLLVTLNDDADPRVRRAVTANPTWVAADRPNRQSRFARSLLRNESPVLRVVGLVSGDVDSRALRRPRHVCSINWLERFAVAADPKTPDDVRAFLAGDPNRVVRAGATGELSWPQR